MIADKKWAFAMAFPLANLTVRGRDKTVAAAFGCCYN